MAKFNVNEIVKATGGRLIMGSGAVAREVGIDSRTIKRGSLFIAITGEKFDGHKFIGPAFDKGASMAMVSDERATGKFPGKTFVVVDDTTEALQALAAYHRSRFARLKIVCVTGSNGKTTVKDMIASVLSQKYKTLKTIGNLNNHIGAPLTLLRLTQKDEAAVVEIGMNAPGEIALLSKMVKPSVGVITNISLAHIGNFKSLKAVRDAKGELLLNMPPRAVAVLNADDPQSRALIENAKPRVMTFGKNPVADVSLTDSWPDSGRGSLAAIHYKNRETQVHIPVAGSHNTGNALAAFCAGIILGVSREKIAKGIEKTKPAPMRMELVTLPNGAALINDSYNANPASTRAAIESAASQRGDGKLIFVFGDMLELGSRAEAEHKRVGAIAAKAGVDAMYTFGKRAKLAARTAAARGVKIKRGKTHQQIAQSLVKFLRPGDTALVKGSRGVQMEKVIERLTAMMEG
ncbi:UDP-N-acetylmuramoyl-tripeptide--D-alanyl-D-alanine ligase [hydrothermal vent metagenome]|uniref:UDP-MurNAc-pentapeptide synthetase n=1 Tax=hydrothermal vent metagenome TaxID=652676 RepID=A0A3B1CK72_9ZZZZ